MTAGSSALPAAGVARAGADVQARQRAHRRSVLFMRWLRKIHLWVGLWGALLGLLFGATGIVLNHRAVLKLPVEKTVQRSVQLALPGDAAEHLATAPQMLAWLQAQLQFEGLQVRTKIEPARTVVWAGREVQQPERWIFNLQDPHKGVNAEYVVGNRFVKADVQDATIIGTLTRLHMAVGVNAFWVLLADTIAGGIIVLSATGLLLWSRLHKVRLTAVAAIATAFVAAACFVAGTA